MLENHLDVFKNLLGIDSKIDLGDITTIGGYVTTTINYFKMRRFKKRLNSHDIVIKRIGDKVNQLDDGELKFFIQTTIFPYVLDDLIEENQDKKIEYILNGFEFIIDEKMSDEGFAIDCFDVLRDLRVDDIIRLLKFTDKYKTKFGLKIEEDSFKKMAGRWSKGEVEKFKKEEIFSKQIDNKLLSKNLISNEKEDIVSKIFRELKMNYRRGGNFDSLESSIRNEVKKVHEYYLTAFGKEFIKVFDLRIVDNEDVD